MLLESNTRKMDSMVQCLADCAELLPADYSYCTGRQCDDEGDQQEQEGAFNLDDNQDHDSERSLTMVDVLSEKGWASSPGAGAPQMQRGRIESETGQDTEERLDVDPPHVSQKTDAITTSPLTGWQAKQPREESGDQQGPPRTRLPPYCALPAAAQRAAAAAERAAKAFALAEEAARAAQAAEETAERAVRAAENAAAGLRDKTYKGAQTSAIKRADASPGDASMRAPVSGSLRFAIESHFNDVDGVTTLPRPLTALRPVIALEPHKSPEPSRPTSLEQAPSLSPPPSPPPPEGRSDRLASGAGSDSGERELFHGGDKATPLAAAVPATQAAPTGVPRVGRRAAWAGRRRRSASSTTTSATVLTTSLSSSTAAPSPLQVATASDHTHLPAVGNYGSRGGRSNSSAAASTQLSELSDSDLSAISTASSRRQPQARSQGAGSEALTALETDDESAHDVGLASRSTAADVGWQGNMHQRATCMSEEWRQLAESNDDGTLGSKLSSVSTCSSSAASKAESPSAMGGSSIAPTRREIERLQRIWSDRSLELDRGTSSGPSSGTVVTTHLRHLRLSSDGAVLIVQPQDGREEFEFVLANLLEVHENASEETVVLVARDMNVRIEFGGQTEALRQFSTMLMPALKAEKGGARSRSASAGAGASANADTSREDIVGQLVLAEGVTNSDEEEMPISHPERLTPTPASGATLGSAHTGRTRASTGTRSMWQVDDKSGTTSIGWDSLAMSPVVSIQSGSGWEPVGLLSAKRRPLLPVTGAQSTASGNHSDASSVYDRSPISKLSAAKAKQKLERRKHRRRKSTSTSLDLAPAESALTLPFHVEADVPAGELRMMPAREVQSSLSQIRARTLPSDFATHDTSAAGVTVAVPAHHTNAATGVGRPLSFKRHATTGREEKPWSPTCSNDYYAAAGATSTEGSRLGSPPRRGKGQVKAERSTANGEEGDGSVGRE